MTEQPFRRLFAFIQNHLLAITILLTLLQIAVWLIDLVVFSDIPKAKWLPPMEMAGTWLLLPVLRWIFGKPRIRQVLQSAYFALIGGYLLVLSLILIGVILAFQILNWYYHGQMSGGIFYYGSLALVFAWSLHRKNPGQPAAQPDSK